MLLMMICNIIGKDCHESQHLIQLVIQRVTLHEKLFLYNTKAHHLLSLLWTVDPAEYKQ